MLDRTQFLVKERVGFLKLVDVYDIFDPATGQQIGIARENPSAIWKYLRLIIDKRVLPTRIEVAEFPSERLLLTMQRRGFFFRAKVHIQGPSGQPLGYFHSKLFSLGGGFWVYDHQGQQVAEIRGNWIGWNFRFLDATGRELGQVTKKWAGIGKELFTTIVLNPEQSSPAASALLLAAGLAIDMVFKEKQ
ncbi:MAG TPA: phospholipid scramblase-related protein [Thermoguttaceae bacterium]|nr:phospholipid scramblase-related protein [Thermoguttaceae bacterium]HPP52115.1 phospholipid scramblase-related protein [Thermoguttaceae bacterium]